MIFQHDRDMYWLKKETVIKVVNHFYLVLCFLMMGMPLGALAVWGGMLIERAIYDGTTVLGGVSVILVGVAFLCFAFGILKIKWNLYRFNWKNIVALVMAYLCLTTWQFLAIFM